MTEHATTSELKKNETFSFSPNDFHQIEDLVKYFDIYVGTEYVSRFSIEPFLKGLGQEYVLSCQHTSDTISDFFKNMSEVIDNRDQVSQNLCDNQDLQSFIQMMIPSMRLSDELRFITPPFSMEIVSKTKRLEELMDSDDFVMKSAHDANGDIKDEINIKRHQLILQKGYGLDIKDENQKVLIIKNVQTGLQKYYNFTFNTDFVAVIFNGKVPKLDQKTIDKLYVEIDNEDLWRQYFPPTLVEFHGFTIGTWSDVTETEILSEVRRDFYQYTFAEDFMDVRNRSERYLRDYLGSNDVHMGIVNVVEDFQDVHPNSRLGSFSEREVMDVINNHPEKAGIYATLTEEHNHAIKDLREDDLTLIESELAQEGYQSLFIYGFYVDHELQAIIEIGSKDAYVVNRSSLVKLRKISLLFEEIFMQLMGVMNNQIRNIIQQKFTAVHPSISWKFWEVANKYHIEHQYNDQAEIGEIVFNDLMPIYGQADIVGSSTLRNEAIKGDLERNLTEINKVIQSWLPIRNLNMLDRHHKTVNALLDNLSKKYNSKDENTIVFLITNELHPYLDAIQKRYNLPSEVYENYKSLLDSKLGIIYDKRKDYEYSVTKINGEISRLIESRDTDMQKVLPHYFEMYKTDGVEYNLYLGQSILETEEFISFDIKEFRLWQLKTMVEVVRLVDEMQPDLALPMTTAQLIFIYNHGLSIRFRMDEKRFDVDGTYNVRYEILKKRIDKATILGTKDRLTVDGKIAIVYVDDKDRVEYLDYIDYLLAEDLITDEIEDLDLNPMQGVDGLKALRISVKS